MIDIKNRNYVPSLEEIGEYIHNSVFIELCNDVKAKYNCKEQIDFSSCSWEYGWNVKFKKSGKTLCTIYPRENYFTVLIVVSKKEKEIVEHILEELNPAIRTVYRETKESNGQKWLMIDLEDNDKVYADIMYLIDIRRGFSRVCGGEQR